MTAARRPLTLILALAATVGLAACGERKEDTAGTEKPPPAKVSLLLDYLPNADHAGIYEAQSDGGFKNAGLDVDIQTPQDPSSVLKLVEAGKVDVGISYEPDVLLAAAKNKGLVVIASLVQKPLTSLMSLPKAKIQTPADLEGKTVGTAGIPYQQAYLNTIAKKAGIPPTSIKQVNVGFNLNQALVSGKVDATLGGFWNVEGVELAQKKRNPVVKPVDQLGVPNYSELVLVARIQTLNAKESAIRRFVRALSLGYAKVRKDPAAGVKPLLQANPNLDAKVQTQAVRETAPAFFPTGKNAKKPWGWLDTDQWADFGQWMLDNGLLKSELPLDNVVTNDYLPGQGAGDGRETPQGAQTPNQTLPGYKGE